jgi:predicted dehydrogenase
MQPIRVGIIGCGAVTQMYHSKALESHSKFEVVGVSDPVSANAEKVANNFRVPIFNLSEVLEVSDLLLVATPPSSHLDIIERIVDARKNIIVEKPFGTSHQRCREILSTQKYLGGNIFVGQLRRFASAVNIAKTLVDCGSIGDIRRIEAFEGGRFSWETQSKYIVNDPFGGVLFDTGAHTLDVALYASGLDCVEIRVGNIRVARDKSQPAHEVHSDCVLHLGNQAIELVLKLSRYQSLSNLVRIVGALGTLEFSVGFDDLVILKSKGKIVRINDPLGPKTFAQCFFEQYESIAEEPDRSRLRGELMLNQIMILNEIHAHR